MFRKLKQKRSFYFMPMTTTMKEAIEKITPYINVPYYSPVTPNKGSVGLLAEYLAGIEHSSAPLDLTDGEQKNISLKKLKNGKIVLKESIAITMLNKKDLLEKEFKDSSCYNKLKRMLIIPYLREGDMVHFTELIIIEKEVFGELFDSLETDYNKIRKNYIETGILTSKTGDFLQNRTKGAGHGTTSRAFYLRPCIWDEIQYIRTSLALESGSLE